MLNQQKDFLRRSKEDILTGIIFALVALLAFGLGRLSALKESQETKPLQIVEPSLNNTRSILTKTSREEEGMLRGLPEREQKKFVASKNGCCYHLPECPGAQRIREENKIWFSSKEEAESYGYQPAKNCPGL